MNETDKELKQAHSMSLKGIFNKYTVSKILLSRGTLISLIITIVIIIGVCCRNDTSINEYYNTLLHVTDIILSLFPNILGFCIGGYTLIIGACSTDTIKKMSAPQKHGLSLFQILSSVFAATLIIQCFTLVIAYIVHFCLLLEIGTNSVVIGVVVNVGVILILLFLSCISLSLLYYTIVNIFNMGQTMHFCISLEEENKKKEKDKQNESDK